MGPEGEFDPDSSHGIIVGMVGSGKRVLEAGCASGYVSRHLARRGNVVTGIDIDAEAAEEARAYCEEVIVADLDVQSLPELLRNKEFDVAVFGDVLEHLRDPWRVLRDARSFLSPGAFVVISIPNIAHGNVRLSLLRGAFDYAPLGILDDSHLRFFTLRSLRGLCLRAGYRIEEIQRTKLPMFLETDVAPMVDEREFSRDLVDSIRRDPEHDTLQFVCRAVPVSGSDQLTLALDALADVEKKLSGAVAKVDRLEGELDEYKRSPDQTVELKALLEDRAGQLNRATALAEDLRSRLAGAERELETTQREADAVRGERLALVEELASLRERDNSLAARLAEAGDLALTLRAEQARLSEELAGALGAAQAAQEELAILRARDDSRVARLAEAAELEVALRAERDRLSQELVGAVRAAQAADNEATAELDRLRAENTSLGATLSEIETYRNEVAARLAEAEEQVLAREAIAAQTAAQLDRVSRELVATAEAAETARNEASAALEELRRENASLDAAKREAETKRDELTARLSEAVATALTREEAVADSFAQLRQSFVVRERELMEIAEERSGAAASARLAEQEAVATIERLRLEHVSLSATQREIEAEREALAERLAGAEALALAREAEASEAMEELRRENATLSSAWREAESEREALLEQLALLQESTRTREEEFEAGISAARVAESEAAAKLEQLHEENALLSETLHDAEGARNALASRLADVEAVADTRERAAADALEGLWELAAERERELTELSENTLGALDSALKGEEKALKALDDLRYRSLSLITERREASSASDGIAPGHDEALELERTRAVAEAEVVQERDRLSQELVEVVAATRVSESEAAATISNLRRDNSRLIAARREAEAARDDLVRKLQETQYVMRSREAAAVKSVVELGRAIAVGELL